MSPPFRQHAGLELHSPEPFPILYLDDDPADADALSVQLSSNVINPVICFDRAAELYDHIESHTGPFIILVDLVLLNDGIGGGYEVISTLTKRADVIETHSPVIAVTGTKADAFLEDRARRTGAAGLIIKPVRVQDLVEVGLGKPGWFRLQLSW